MRLLLPALMATVVLASPYDNPARSSSPFQIAGTETVPFEVVEQKGEYKLIKVPASKWVCTNSTINTNEDPFKNWQEKFDGNGRVAMVGVKDSPTSKMFKKLFKYIVGVNSQSANIDMTRPVIDKVHQVFDGMVEMKMCFWTGTPWQDKKLPAPIDKDVYVKEMKEMHFFVRTFGGYALSMDDWLAEKKLLVESLKDRTDADVDGDFLTAGFDGPWTVENRRNEVWIPKKMKMEDEVMAETKDAAEVSEDESLESISYSVIDSGDAWELRQYPAAKWICTAMGNINPASDPMNGWEDKYNNNPYVAMASSKWKDQTSSKMFMKLFKYIAGVNKGNVEIDMTTPVTMAHNPTIAPKEAQEMCFWLGSKYQNEKPPAPLMKDVQIISKDAFKAYVHTFGGFALSYDDFHGPYMALKGILKEEGKTDIAKVNWAHVSYNSPFTPKNRRNEVWIEQQ